MKHTQGKPMKWSKGLHSDVTVRNECCNEWEAYHKEIISELLEACKELVKGYEVKMGKSAIKLRIELLKDAIAKAEK